jgi:hypothetical protein
MMRLHSGAGAVMSWEPDPSSRVMTPIATSLEPLKNKDWDNGKPGPTGPIRPLEHTCDHIFCPLP